MPLSAQIQNYVDEHKITSEQANRLTEAQLRNLESNAIRELIVDGTLTFEQALDLKEIEFRNLESASIRSLIDKNEAITFWQTLGLIPSQLWDPESTEFIEDRTLTLEQAMGLTTEQRLNLESRSILRLIANGTLTVEQALKLTAEESINLRSNAILNLIADGYISLEEAKGLTLQERHNLKSQAIQDLIINGTLTLNDAKTLNDNERLNLETKNIRTLIADGILTLEEAKQITPQQRENLSTAIVDLIVAGHISLEQAKALNPVQSENFRSQNICDLIANGTLNFEEAKELNWEQRYALDTPWIRELIAGEALTLKQVKELYYGQILILRRPDAIQRLKSGEFTIEELLISAFLNKMIYEGILTNEQARRIKGKHIVALCLDVNIRDRLSNRELAIEDFLNAPVPEPVTAEMLMPMAGILTPPQVMSMKIKHLIALRDANTRERLIRKELAVEDFLIDPQQRPLSTKIQNYVQEGRITEREARGLNIGQRRSLNSDVIRGMIVDGTLTIEQAKQLTDEQCLNLESASIRSLIDKYAEVTLWQALGLFTNQLWNPESTAFIADKTLTLEQAIALDSNQRKNLESTAIRDLIANGTFTLQEAKDLTDTQRKNLESEAIRRFIANGTLTLKEAIELRDLDREALELKTIQNLIADGTISFDQVLRLTGNPIRCLEQESICDLIDNRTLSLDQAMGLSPSQRGNLESTTIRNLIADKTLSLEQFMRLPRLSVEELNALADNDTQQRLRNGELTIENVLGVRVQDNQGTPQPQPINDSQSTHTASVHRTVSESATRLMNRYADVMNPTTLNQLISTITNEINALPDGNPQNEAAKRCVARLGAPEYAYTDQTSGINTRELLALSWLAIHDNNARLGTLEDAKRQFIEGLYEIQRGYNLSAAGVDMQGADISICSGGTFNKLMEKLNGVHQDVVIKVITPQLFALKLPIVVKEEVKNYLASKANPATISEFIQFTELTKKIETEGMESIWGAIRDKVSTRLFDEFGSLYENEQDPKFTAIIEIGNDVEINPLPSFKNQLLKSEGYREYCRATHAEAMKLLKQNPENLLEYLLKSSVFGTANFHLLSIENRNEIVFDRRFADFQKLMNASTHPDLSQLQACLNREELNFGNRAEIVWNQHSSKPLLAIEFDKISENLQDMIDLYKEKRSASWWKGSANSARLKQIEELNSMIKEIEAVLKSDPPNRERMVEVLKNTDTVLNKIDQEISKERNLFSSALQQEVRAFRNKFSALCPIDNFAFLSADSIRESITKERDVQINGIRNDDVQDIVYTLPAHCQNKEAIELFNQLDENEAFQVASYLQLGYKPFTSPVDKQSLLSDTIPAAFKAVNEPVLDSLKDQIPKENFNALKGMTGTIRPEFFTANNVSTWGASIKEVADNILKDLLIEISEVNALIKANKGNDYTEEQIARIQQLLQSIKEAKQEDFRELVKLPEAAQNVFNSFETHLKQINIEPKDTRRKTQTLRDELRGIVGTDDEPTTPRKEV
jgi:hypothetical protein